MPIIPILCEFLKFRRTAWSFSSGGTKSAFIQNYRWWKTWNKIHNGFQEGREE
jgi:hypothetical protein